MTLATEPGESRPEWEAWTTEAGGRVHAVPLRGEAVWRQSPIVATPLGEMSLHLDLGERSRSPVGEAKSPPLARVQPWRGVLGGARHEGPCLTSVVPTIGQ